MFDRPPPSQPDAAEVAESVDRLCRLYDSRLAETGGDLSSEDARDGVEICIGDRVVARGELVEDGDDGRLSVRIVGPAAP